MGKQKNPRPGRKRPAVLKHHLSIKTLASYLKGKLSAAREAQVADHLAGGCATCNHWIEFLQRSLAKEGR